MISGALLLNDHREVTYKEFLTKRINKIFIPLFGWSAIYYFYNVYIGNYVFSPTSYIEMFSTNGISYHLWFIYMMLGLYLITPIVKIFVRNASKRDIRYFLLLWFYASVVAKLLKYLYGFSFNIELYYVTNYVGYYLLGYYLFRYELSLMVRRIIYVGAIAGSLGTFWLTYISTKNADGALQEFWYEYHSPNVMLATIGIFVFFKYMPINNERKLPPIPKLINYTSFGIYLVHMLSMRVLSTKFSLIWFDVHPAFAIPYKVVLTLAVSIIIISIMKKIPVVNKLVP